jgi:dihydrofolate reductase
VVSTTTAAADYPEGVVVAPSLNEALNVAFAKGVPVWVIGGERLYQEALVHAACRHVHATIIEDYKVEGRPILETMPHVEAPQN